VVERGYRVPDVAARSGVSAHSLYKRGKAVSPGQCEQQSQELLKAKSEVLRLRSQLRRASSITQSGTSRGISDRSSFALAFLTLPTLVLWRATPVV
jgi:transposase-like protein